MRIYLLALFLVFTTFARAERIDEFSSKFNIKNYPIEPLEKREPAARAAFYSDIRNGLVKLFNELRLDPTEDRIAPLVNQIDRIYVADLAGLREFLYRLDLHRKRSSKFIDDDSVTLAIQQTVGDELRAHEQRAGVLRTQDPVHVQDHGLPASGLGILLIIAGFFIGCLVTHLAYKLGLLLYERFATWRIREEYGIPVLILDEDTELPEGFHTRINDFIDEIRKSGPINKAPHELPIQNFLGVSLRTALWDMRCLSIEASEQDATMDEGKDPKNTAA